MKTVDTTPASDPALDIPAGTLPAIDYAAGFAATLATEAARDLGLPASQLAICPCCGVILDLSAEPFAGRAQLAAERLQLLAAAAEALIRRTPASAVAA